LYRTSTCVLGVALVDGVGPAVAVAVGHLEAVGTVAVTAHHRGRPVRRRTDRQPAVAVDAAAGARRRQFSSGDRQFRGVVAVGIGRDDTDPLVDSVRGDTDPLGGSPGGRGVPAVEDPPADDEFGPAVAVHVRHPDPLGVADTGGDEPAVRPRSPPVAWFLGDVVVADDLGVPDDQRRLGLAVAIVVVDVGERPVVVPVVAPADAVLGHRSRGFSGCSNQ